MLAQEQRLPAKIKTKFSFISGNLFNLGIAENKGRISRFGFIVKKTTAPSSVKRNRLKRQFRRFFEENYSRIKPGCDFLFKIKKEALDKKTEQIHKEIIKILEEQKYYNEKSSN
jgi:ribonuclease P protein component